MSFYRAADSNSRKFQMAQKGGKSNRLVNSSTKNKKNYSRKFIYLEEEENKTEVQSNQANQENMVQNERGDLDFAKRHSRANKVGYEDKSIPPFYCTCCMKNINKIDFSMDCSIEDLAEVDIGYVLYFKFLEKVKSVIKAIFLKFVELMKKGKKMRKKAKN